MKEYLVIVGCPHTKIMISNVVKALSECSDEVMDEVASLAFFVNPSDADACIWLAREYKTADDMADACKAFGEQMAKAD